MCPQQPWFESFFVEGEYAQTLARIPPEQTEREVDFIVGALALPAKSRILDLCCGVGRHTVALAGRGFSMAGLDLDGAALALARQRAEEAGAAIEFVRADMREIPFREELDGVINVFSSLGYYDTDEEDAEVLAAVSHALKVGGRFLIDVVNRERILAQYRPTESGEEPDGSRVSTTRDLDLMTSRHRVTDVIVRPDGREQRRWHTFRFYSLTELARNLGTVGLETQRVWGDFDGSPYGLESRRMILLAEKRRGR